MSALVAPKPTSEPSIKSDQVWVTVSKATISSSAKETAPAVPSLLELTYIVLNSGGSIAVTVTSSLLDSSPSLASRLNTYSPTTELGKSTVVSSALGSLKVAVPGPLT